MAQQSGIRADRLHAHAAAGGAGTRATLGLQCLLTDAEVHRFPAAAHDAVVSRFRPHALRRTRRGRVRPARPHAAPRAGGPAQLVTWRDPGTNAWLALPSGRRPRARRPGTRRGPRRSGTLPRFADPDLVHDVLWSTRLADHRARAGLTPYGPAPTPATRPRFFKDANGHKLAAAAPTAMARVVDTLLGRLELSRGPTACASRPRRGWITAHGGLRPACPAERSNREHARSPPPPPSSSSPVVVTTRQIRGRDLNEREHHHHDDVPAAAHDVPARAGEHDPRHGAQRVE